MLCLWMLQGFESWMPWAANPLYALLHESIYCQGTGSRWSAHRVRLVRPYMLTTASHKSPYPKKTVIDWVNGASIRG